MAFTIRNWCRASASANEPIVSYTVPSGTEIAGCFREYNYYSADTEVTISAASYFDDVSGDLVTGDYINSYSTTDLSKVQYRVTNTSGVITVVLLGGKVSTVTAITAALFNGMYAAPIELIAAPGANRLLVLESCVLGPSAATTTDYAAGGAVHIQYTADANGAGLLATATIAATEYTSDAETTTSLFLPIQLSANSAAGAGFEMQNEPLCLSNATQAFTTGTVTYSAFTSARIVPTA
jgi:hypothetical protein